jgi:hypothetical protein
MIGSQNRTFYEILKAPQTVFTPALVAQLTGESDRKKLTQRINYYVRTGQLKNLRRGIYAKDKYNKLELACSLYTFCYVSLQYVLQKSGVIFQYDSTITMVSYLSREIEVDNNTYSYRKIKGEIMVNMIGIENDGSVNIATPERAALDTLYLYPDFYFDNIEILDKKKVFDILPIYRNKKMEERVTKLLK